MIDICKQNVKQMPFYKHDNLTNYELSHIHKCDLEINKLNLKQYLNFTIRNGKKY